MSRHRFHLVNVFASSALSGNALCVFEDGRALTDAQMQALALQFNLSETTFVLPSSVATARARPARTSAGGSWRPTRRGPSR